MYNYKELIVWQKSMVLVEKVYTLTASFPPEEKFGFTSQIRRCAVSIPSNIAEGTGRKSKKAFRSFLEISNGSMNELKT
ncbi:four helix bundle protein [Zobellia uliginosa]|uniref:Four helix bundle protein n=1 Tax=Zobellia uliginosa TaxID=143224 RepID=A0ABY1KJG8_9FLAO|nr:four helix bundle protein [Zobellia uliginosa]SIS41730.1 four helix bundle protein [Zobellia uliginosa]